MTYDRSADDLPLAAYGGSGMDLSTEDEAKIELAAEPDDVPAPVVDDQVAPGSLDDAPTLDLAGEPGVSDGTPAATALVDLGSQAVTLLRTSRIAAGAAFGAVILVGLVLVAGGGPGPGAASVAASPSAAPVAFATTEPGNATLVLTGKVNQSLAFAAMSGAGTPNAPLAATWTDAGPNTLAIEGAADRGTRYTDETLVLRFTVAVKNKPVRFTSDAGECTIGMAVSPTGVSGTFRCRNLRSDDGKLVVGATGTYRT